MQWLKACDCPLRTLTCARPDVGHLGRECNSRLPSASPRCFSRLHQPFTGQCFHNTVRRAKHPAHQTTMATEQSTPSTMSSEEARDDDVRPTSSCALLVPDSFMLSLGTGFVLRQDMLMSSHIWRDAGPTRLFLTSARACSCSNTCSHQ